MHKHTTKTPRPTRQDHSLMPMPAELKTLRDVVGPYEPDIRIAFAVDSDRIDYDTWAALVPEHVRLLAVQESRHASGPRTEAHRAP